MRPRASTDTDGNLQTEVLRQQQDFLVERIPMVAIMSAVYALIVVIAIWSHGGAGGDRLSEQSLPHVVWFSLVASTSIVLLLSRLWRRPPAWIGGGALDWARIWAAGLGALWSSAVYLFYSDDVMRQYFLIVVIAGLAAGTVAFLAPLPRVNECFLFALLVPFAARFMMDWELAQISAVGLCILYGVALRYGSWESYKSFVDLVRSQIKLEKARSDLEDALESTNDAFALFDEKRRLVTSNSRFRDWFAGALRVWGGDSKGQVRQLESGRWVVSTIRPTSRGGWVSVHVDVSALKAREEELLAAKLRAEEADRAKTQFLANMSHELRTPLNAIIGFSKMLRDQAFAGPGGARYRSYAEDVYDSGRHLLSIINDILDLSKVEHVRSDLVLEPVDLRDTAEWCVSVCLEREERSAGRQVRVEIDEHAAWIETDRRALKQILINLVANALKFTPAEGRVGLRADPTEDGGIAVAVWDEGIGIPPEKIDEVRKPFFQVESDLAKRYDGTGLGLAIVDALARSLGAELVIASEKGRGSTFTVRFPPERVCAPPAEGSAAIPPPMRAAEGPAPSML